MDSNMLSNSTTQNDDDISYVIDSVNESVSSNDNGYFLNSMTQCNDMYSEISSETLPSTTINESTVTEIPFSDESYLHKSNDTQVTSYLNKESYDTQIAN